ncbi:MAG: type II toxin-antitoxin system VapC family toxin [Parachlamydiaceae bacterium]
MRSFRKTVDRLSLHEAVFISPISIWEFGMLVQKRRIVIEMDLMDWVQQALAVSGINLLPISPRIAIESSRLPGDIQGDPADRLLLATAYEENAVLVTCDEKLLKYGGTGLATLFDPR